MAGDCFDRTALDRYAAPHQAFKLFRIRLEGAVEQQCDLSPVGQHQGMMHGQFRPGDDADLALVQFIAVAIGAVEYRLAPALRKAGDFRQDVPDARRQKQPARAMVFAIGQNLEACARGIDHRGAPGAVCPCRKPAHGRVFQYLRLRVSRDSGRINPILCQKAMRMAGKAVAALPLINDEHIAPGAAELKGGGKARIAATDDNGVVNWIVHDLLRVFSIQHK